jgi:uncharacterized protein YcbX
MPAGRTLHIGSDLVVAGLWRYPVKSLAGEAIPSSAIDTTGVPGDRLVRVMGPEGVRTSRSHRHYKLLGLQGSIDEFGQATINGIPWVDDAALALVRDVAGSDAWLEATDDEAEGGPRFDILPLLVATDGAVAAFGRDVRRLRPNILIGGADDLVERTWPGSHLVIGSPESGAIIRLDSLRGRCPMTTVDPDTLARDPEVLKDIGRRFGGQLALNADVLRGGLIAVGDPVAFVK